jgi:hypothetical protein
VQPWSQQVLKSGRPIVDELLADSSIRLAAAMPVRTAGTLAGAPVGVVGGRDRLISCLEGPGQQLLLLSSRAGVALPMGEPRWRHAPDFDGRMGFCGHSTEVRPGRWTITGRWPHVAPAPAGGFHFP